MLRDRLQRLSHEPDTSLVAPSVQIASYVTDWSVATIAVSGRISDWKKVVTDLEHEHRRAFLHGFTAKELSDVKASYVAGYEEAVRTAPSRPSEWLAGQLVNDLLAGRVFITPAAQQADLADVITASTLRDCHRAFTQTWTGNAPHVFVSAHPSFRITREQLAAAFNESRKIETPGLAERVAPTALAYHSFGPPGQIARDDHLDDLDVHLTQFANGVRFNFKATKLVADAVDIHLRVGEGKLSQPKNQPGLDLLADAALMAGGVGRHTAQELGDLMAGHIVSLSFQIESDACVFSAHCARRDLNLCLQVIAAYLTDAAYRAESRRGADAQFGSMYSSLAAAAGGPITMFAAKELFGGDPRFGIPNGDQLTARTLAELSDWLDPQLKHGAIEMSAVGDVSWDEARVAVAQTIGALPMREPRGDSHALANVHFSASSGKPTIYAIDPKLSQSAISWCYPVPTVKDTHEERRCYLLAYVLAERLRVKLREELGATYSPTATFVRTSGFPSANYFQLYAEVPPARVQQAVQIVRREMTALADKGLDADEFTRAKQPYVHAMEDDLQTNYYWSTTVLSDAQDNPTRITAARDRKTDLPMISQVEIAKLARQFLVEKNVLVSITLPIVVKRSAH